MRRVCAGDACGAAEGVVGDEEQVAVGWLSGVVKAMLERLTANCAVRERGRALGEGLRR